MQGQPYSSFEDFLERKGSNCDKGNVATLVRAGCFDSLVPNRRALEESLDWENSPDRIRCQNKDESVVAAHGLPCTFDWDGEPVELTKTGKPKKRKDPPKRCTRACRNYTAPADIDFSNVDPYTDVEIRERERELLGIFLSSSPFDIIPDAAWEDDPTSDIPPLRKASQVEVGGPGQYFVAATVSSIRQHIDRNGNEMGFLSLMAVDGSIDVTIFKDAWKTYKDVIFKDALCIAEIIKNDRGVTLRHYQPL
jgi:DNA polymerase-3 subunit alpha